MGIGREESRNHVFFLPKGEQMRSVLFLILLFPVLSAGVMDGAVAATQQSRGKGQETHNITALTTLSHGVSA